jgi:hypothetical protein
MSETTPKPSSGEKISPVPTSAGSKGPSLWPLTTQSHEKKKAKKPQKRC